MKKLIALLLLLVGIIGCSNSSINSDGSFDNEDKPYKEPFFWDDLRDRSE